MYMPDTVLGSGNTAKTQMDNSILGHLYSIKMEGWEVFGNHTITK